MIRCGENVSRLFSLSTLSRVVFRMSCHCTFHLPGSLRSPGPQKMNTARLHHYYGTSDSCSAALRIHTAAVAPPEPPSRTVNTDLLRTGLSASCTPTSDRSGSNHPLPPRTLASLRCTFWFNHGPRLSPLVHHALRDPVAHRLRPWREGSSRRKTESTSLSFRTNRSPPDALHPASRRRSFGQLQDQTPTS